MEPWDAAAAAAAAANRPSSERPKIERQARLTDGRQAEPN